MTSATWQRFTKKAEAVSYVWDSTAGKVVFGMNVVLLIWTDGERKIPIGLRIWKKGGRSKVKLAKDLLRVARKNGLSPEYVLFDSWYAATELLNLLDQFGWKYIGGVKRNRLLDEERIDKLFHHRFGRRTGYLRKVDHQVLIVKNGKKYYLTNAVTQTSRQIRLAYKRRQQIEETFRLLKQEFGWGKCRARTKKAQKADLHLGLYALCLVQMKAEDRTVYQFKQDLFREAIPTQNQFIEAFTVSA